MSGLIKICGLTREQDVSLVREAGVDYAGFIFAPSPRRVAPEDAIPFVKVLEGSGVEPVGVFVNEEAERIREFASLTGIRYIQLSGDEPDDFLAGSGLRIIRAVAVRDETTLAGAARRAGDLLLLDSWDPARRGGTGKTLSWEDVARASLRRPFLLAGGLEPDNVKRAIDTVRPAGVDVSSGVEEAPGIKSESKVRIFVERARAAFGQEGGDR